MILLKNCRLIPELTEGYEGLVADVLIDAKKIRQIAEPGTIEAEADVQVIDIEGNTLLPGFLISMHTCIYRPLIFSPSTSAAQQIPALTYMVMPEII